MKECNVAELREPGTNLLSLKLTEKQFNRISGIVYKVCGINLQFGKEELVKARLMKRLRALDMMDFNKYIDYVESQNSHEELEVMIDVLTTNKTSFFREERHFEFIKNEILPKITNKQIRLWSAGCSSGEEPYSLAILMKEELSNIELKNIKILATDISSRVLSKAQEGVYEESILSGLPSVYLKKYFVCLKKPPNSLYKVNDSIKEMISFARLNLMENWPMNGPFDAIFCRNVMIYFDRPTRERLVNRFWQLLNPGGYFFVGHSESLTGFTHQFSYVQPAIYIK